MIHTRPCFFGAFEGESSQFTSLPSQSFRDQQTTGLEVVDGVKSPNENTVTGAPWVDAVVQLV